MENAETKILTTVMFNGNQRDWRPKGPRIDSKSGHCQVMTFGKLFTHVPLFTKQYNLVPVVKGR